MDVKIEQSWKNELQEEFSKDYFLNLTEFVRKEYASTRIFPPGNRIFAAFDATPFDKVKVVILGQDPYHGENQANGLCFSVGDGVPFPLPCSTSSRKSSRTSAARYPKAATSPAGRSKAYCCSTQR